MTALRVLHIDDEPDIRDIVALSLGLDPEMTIRGCASGKDGLAAASEGMSDVILLDVMMPVMDGPTTLARLRQDPRTSDIPVVFMTARAQGHEIEKFRLLGAAGVIAKPFDPMTLAASLRSHVPAPDDVLAAPRKLFLHRVDGDTEALARCLLALSDETARVAASRQIRAIAHGLAGAGGIFGFPEIGDVAAELEDAAIGDANGVTSPAQIVCLLEKLLVLLKALFKA